jgi:minor extracellular protease Epr
MSKKIIMAAGLLLIMVGGLYLITSRNGLSESEVVQISDQHLDVQGWLKKQQAHLANSTSLYRNASTKIKDSNFVKQETVHQNGFWVVTYQSKSGQNPMVMNVTIDENSGEVLSVTEEDRVIVLFKEKVNVEAITDLKGQVIGLAEEIPMVAATVPKDEIGKLAENYSVIAVEDDQVLSIHQQTTDWGIEKVKAPTSWNSGFTGKGIKVAVIDSGIDTAHQDLSVVGGASFVSYTNSYHDDNGHGTHVAGIIGALNNNLGTIGSAFDSSIYAVKVLDSQGRGYLSEIIAGIDWAISNNMDIINLSLGTDAASQSLKSIVDKTYQNGIAVVASSGNSGSSETIDNVGYPARYESVIAVGAVDPYSRVTDFSSSGQEVEVAAPGLGIMSTYAGNTYKKMSGTSMAAPYVSGIIAMLKQANPNASASEIRSILQKSVIDLGDFGRDRFYGYGLIQSSPSFSIHGRNRYETSVMISQSGWPNGSTHVILGRGDIPIDALTGSILASKLESPILLTESSRLPIEVMKELQRLKPTTVIILGGEVAISQNIENELISNGYNVTRISGSNRYDTARKVAEQVYTSGEVFLTTGNNTPDPLSIAPYAGMMASPILLTPKDSLPKEVQDFLQGNKVDKVTIIGGEAAISKGIESKLVELGINQIDRISGVDRYSTSAEIVRRYREVFTGPVYVASGNSFVDALPGTALAAKNKSPIILVHKDYVPLPIKEILHTVYPHPRQLFFLGGYVVITIDTRAKLEGI